jgi:hypothetical protein
MVYLTLHEKLGLSYIMREYHTDMVYSYETIQDMLNMNINMVCGMETVIPDGSTLRLVATKQSTGQPKKKRIRKRLQWACDPEKSNFVYSRCKCRGHNVRTCLAMEENEQDRSGYELGLL